ncbi:MAG: iron-containing redox enzyme family protein [Gammaproteobacteria bacterium]|nr:iron-containing redox enzyme family protein [Gammaproteobacteria bacterium]
MKYFDRLQAETETERQHLLATPLINDCIAGKVSLPLYVAYLCQAYHHVKHTVPLLMATGSRIGESQEWLREALAEYIAEEQGHQEWILNDIVACGFDREAARQTQPTHATEMLVAYAYDTIQRVNPIGFFGMVHVLEGTSIVAADKAAQGVQRALRLPAKAFTYLRSHGALDQDHVQFFMSLMNRIEDPEEQRAIIHCAKNFYHLFGEVLNSVAAEQVAMLPANSHRDSSHAA